MRLTGAANVLIMPAIHSASISTKLVQALGGATVVGPILLGLSKSVQICPLSASVSKILNMALMAAYEQPFGDRSPGLNSAVRPCARADRETAHRAGGIGHARRRGAIGIDFGTTNTVISASAPTARRGWSHFAVRGRGASSPSARR